MVTTERLFDAIDTNGTEMISKEELGQFFNHMGSLIIQKVLNVTNLVFCGSMRFSTLTKAVKMFDGLFEKYAGYFRLVTSL